MSQIIQCSQLNSFMKTMNIKTLYTCIRINSILTAHTATARVVSTISSVSGIYILTATPTLSYTFTALAIWFRTACIMNSQGDNLNYQVTKAMRKCTPAILLYYTFEVPNYAWEGEMVQKSMFLQHIP